MHEPEKQLWNEVRESTGMVGSLDPLTSVGLKSIHLLVLLARTVEQALCQQNT